MTAIDADFCFSFVVYKITKKVTEMPWNCSSQADGLKVILEVTMIAFTFREGLYGIARNMLDDDLVTLIPTAFAVKGKPCLISCETWWRAMSLA